MLTCITLVWVLLLKHVVAVADTKTGGLYSADVWILSIGSTSRPELQDTQATTVGKYFKLITHNELTVEKCSVCEVGDGIGYPPGAMSRTSNKVSGHYHKIVSPAWWCAQKRVLPALQQVIDIPADELPSFLLVVDDDTHINPSMLQAFVKTHNPDDYVFAGDVIFEHGKGLYPKATRHRHPPNSTTRIATPLVGGGGGSFISRAVLLKLQPVIKACVAKSQSGVWCDWHSDWALSQCIFESSTTSPITAAPFFSQFWGLRRCNKYSVTCHGKMNVTRLTGLHRNYTGVLTDEQMQLFYEYMEALRQDDGNATATRIHQLAFTIFNTTKMNDQSFATLGVNPYGIYIWSSLISHAISQRLASRPPLPVARLEQYRKDDIEAIMLRHKIEGEERKQRQTEKEQIKKDEQAMKMVAKQNSVRNFIEKQQENDVEV